jgi:Glycosyl transferase family 2
LAATDSDKKSVKFIRKITKEIERQKSKARRVAAGVKRAARRGRGLEIEVITMMYNEAFLAPLFVRHYAPWVDKITVFYSQSADDTKEQLQRTATEFPHVRLDIVPFEFPNGFDDQVKIHRIHQALRESAADFCVCVDADEFVHPWPFEKTNPRDELARETGEVVYCAMFECYRHATEPDVDSAQPPLFQRRHGVLEQEKTVDGKIALQKDRYTKPCIVRPDSGAEYVVGCHRLVTPKRGETIWRGVHWGRADNFCLLRYTRDRRDRLSEANRKNNFGVEHFTASQEKLAAELKAHANDPKLF